jgi:hypothetical protein
VIVSDDKTDGEFGGTARFEVLGRIGQGGMGVVYRARDRERGAEVAMKVLRTVGGDALLRFKNELRALADLRHPNLCGLGELAFDGGRWFFTMELVDGVDLLRWVRPNGALDEVRLRAALAQLAAGLAALHAGARVHRDIKPSNVLCTETGRVVLVDFGLATAAGGRRADSDPQILGTVDYMAPEQAAARGTGPPADCYSVGVMLYEALAGRLPFAGAPLEVLLAKQDNAPLPLPNDAPADLAALALRLLERDPATRAGVDAILALTTREATPAVAPLAGFVGRTRELETLNEAITVASGARGIVQVVRLSGESGVGKTALVERFLDDVAARQPGALTLYGRSFLRERMPYQGFDGVVDALARALKRMPRAEAAALLPLDVARLAQAFPVLRRVPAVAEAPLRSVDGDAQTQRARLFASLRELFARSAARAPVVVALDDVQWLDADSIELLRAMLREPDPPAVLWLLSGRTPAASDAGAAELGRIGVPVRELQLGRLPPAEAQALAATFGDTTLADEGRGHPLFIIELGRYRRQHGGELSLDDALTARAARLPDAARRLLEVVALAGRPVPAALAGAAAKVSSAELDRVAGLLDGERLLRSVGARDAQLLEPYHDRVRQAAITALDAARARAHHAALVAAIEAAPSDNDDEALSRHLEGAGELKRAAVHAARAAEAAAKALAFERASRLFRRAIALDSASSDRPVWGTRLGEALASLGRSGDAALAFLDAARVSTPDDALALQNRAAQQLLVGGHVDEGLAALSTVLRAVGLDLPIKPRAALRALFWEELRLRFRGLGFKERAAADISPEVLRRVDACWSVTSGLGMVDLARSGLYQARHLRLALDAGEPLRVARALAISSAIHGSLGAAGARRARKLADRAERLATRLDDAHALGLVAMGRGIHQFVDGNFPEARLRCDEGLRIFRERRLDLGWETSVAQQFAWLSRIMLGQLGDLIREMPALRRRARERGNHYEATYLRTGLFTLAALAADEPERARDDIAEVMSNWSRAGYQLQHQWDLIACVMCDLYGGDGRTALDRIAQRWPALTESQLRRVAYIDTELHLARARAALATAARLPPDSSERRPLYAQIESDLAITFSERRVWCHGWSTLLSAALAAARGDTEDAARRCLDAERLLGEAGMALHVAVARLRRGQLNDPALALEAETTLIGMRIRRPIHLAAVLAPGFPE